MNEETKIQSVYIPDRAEHQGIYGIYVNLRWVCPICGQPRGQVLNGRSYDGSLVLAVDTWKNPCGHIDKYDDVRNEAESNGLNNDCIHKRNTTINLFYIAKIQRATMHIFEEQDSDFVDGRVVKANERAIDKWLNKITLDKDEQIKILDIIERNNFNTNDYTYKPICDELRALGYTVIEGGK